MEYVLGAIGIQELMTAEIEEENIEEEEEEEISVFEHEPEDTEERGHNAKEDDKIDNMISSTK